MDGFDVCRKLKAHEKLQHIPVIFMRTLADMTHAVKGFDIGGVDYLTKPFQYQEVLARVKAYLTIRWQHQQIQHQHAALEAQSLASMELNAHLQELNARLEQEIREHKQVREELAEAKQELQRLAALDGLTQVANRRLFDEYLSREWQRMAREQMALSLILCDIDHFQRYSDTYGHSAGNECLKQVAQGLQCAVRRPADLVARYDGEEFAMVLPNTNQEGALHVARSIQTEIQHINIPHTCSDADSFVTLSIGLATMIPQYGHSIQLLLKIADDALDEAKQQGRNRIVTRTLSLLH
jgi:diguanylate cyclase (GGDEF)-like protein